MIREAYISGQIAKAICFDGQRLFVCDPKERAAIECSPIDFSTFFNFGAEITVLLNAPDIPTVLRELTDQTERHRALTLTISGMDDLLDLDSRSYAITTAEELTAATSTYQFVRARLLARPAPDEADLETAVDISARLNASKLAALYRAVLAYDTIIALVYESWVKTAQDHLSTQRELIEYQRFLTDLGVFADLVTAISLSNRKALKSIVVRVGRARDVFDQPRALPIVNDLKNRIVEAWPSSKYEPNAPLPPEPNYFTADAFEPGDIAGVVVHDLRKFEDRRGWLSELFRQDELGSELPAMGYVASTKPGAIRGPHEHSAQVDLFCFLGPSNFELRLWDHRLDSPTFGRVMTLVVGADNPQAIWVPKHVVHAYRNIGNVDGVVINYSNKLYRGAGRQEPIDEIRHEDDPDTIFLMED